MPKRSSLHEDLVPCNLVSEKAAKQYVSTPYYDMCPPIVTAFSFNNIGESNPPDSNLLTLTEFICKAGIELFPRWRAIMFSLSKFQVIKGTHERIMADKAPPLLRPLTPLTTPAAKGAEQELEGNFVYKIDSCRIENIADLKFEVVADANRVVKHVICTGKADIS